MRLFITGLWHCGIVTAASMAQHHQVVGHDVDLDIVASLTRGEPPLYEPGLRELVKKTQVHGSLTFSSGTAEAREADIVWVTYDTPVDDDDRSDVEQLFARCQAVFADISDGTTFLVSSQVPVGFTSRLATAFVAARPNVAVSFAYSPENLRLGKALETFNNPGRVVVGTCSEADRPKLRRLFAPICENIVWMSVESAEMTKHALNAFLAVSVTFANEVAALCEVVGANFEDVQRGLRTDPRIGVHAYLSAGAGISAATLLRDVSTLAELGANHRTPSTVLAATLASNKEHRKWVERSLGRYAGELQGRKIAVLGLTYKPGTSTLRRSSAVDLCRWLATRGAIVEAYDPVVKELPPDLGAIVQLRATVEEALSEATAAVVATQWPEFLSIDSELAFRLMNVPRVFDASGFLKENFALSDRVGYFMYGRSMKNPRLHALGSRQDVRADVADRTR